jgi:hypothetical protein
MADLDTADYLVFLASILPDAGPTKRPHQKFVLYNLENEFFRLDKPYRDFLNNVDWTVSYQLNATVPATYCPVTLSELEQAACLNVQQAESLLGN